MQPYIFYSERSYYLVLHTFRHFTKQYLNYIGLYLSHKK